LWLLHHFKSWYILAKVKTSEAVFLVVCDPSMNEL
jgi:hypothetical protein